MRVRPGTFQAPGQNMTLKASCFQKGIFPREPANLGFLGGGGCSFDKLPSLPWAKLTIPALLVCADTTIFISDDSLNRLTVYVT